MTKKKITKRKQKVKKVSVPVVSFVSQLSGRPKGDIFTGLDFKKIPCDHRRDDGTPNIKWMEHSNQIVKGVCGQCYARYDTRNPEDKVLFDADPKAKRNMGRVTLPSVTPRHISTWQKIKFFLKNMFKPAGEKGFKRGTNLFGEKDCLIPEDFVC